MLVTSTNTSHSPSRSGSGSGSGSLGLNSSSSSSSGSSRSGSSWSSSLSTSTSITVDERHPAAPEMVLKPCKEWDFNYQPQLVGRISEPSNSKSHKLPENLGWEPAGVLLTREWPWPFFRRKSLPTTWKPTRTAELVGTGSFPRRNLGSGSLPKAFRFFVFLGIWDSDSNLVKNSCNWWMFIMRRQHDQNMFETCFRCWLYIKRMKPLTGDRCHVMFRLKDDWARQNSGLVRLIYQCDSWVMKVWHLEKMASVWWWPEPARLEVFYVSLDPFWSVLSHGFFSPHLRFHES